jgi:membrane protein implicated in regulation of membrane protease activity
MEWLESLFLGAFVFGLVLTVVSVLLGGHLGLGHHSLHLPDLQGGHGIHFGDPAAVGPASHVGQGAPTVDGGHGDVGAQISPWNLTAITAFVAWFGGIGYLAMTAWQLAIGLSLLVAVVAGLAGWAVVSWFYARMAAGAEGRLDPADYQLEGTLARVTVPIGADRSGEIQFSRGGARRSEGARSVDGTAIPRGTEVVVVRYDRGIAYVQPWEAYVEPAAPEGRQGGI